MSFRFVVCPETHAVLAVAGDVLDVAALVDVARSTVDHPDFQSTMRQLVFIPASSEVRLSGADLRAFAERPPIFAPSSRRAIVAEPASVGFGVSRMFEIMKDGLAGEILVTSDVTEACRHVDLDMRDVDALLAGLLEFAVWPRRA